MMKTIKENISLAVSTALVFSLMTLFGTACAPRATTTPPAAEEPAEKATAETFELKPRESVETPEEVQKEKALQDFSSMHEMTRGRHRSEMVPELEAGFLNIMENYPESDLAQESYWHLVNLYLRDSEPPQVEKAERVRQLLRERYPDSSFHPVLMDTFARFYYREGYWPELKETLRPFVRRYIRGETIRGPFYLFLYSEALNFTGDHEEARKGYLGVINLFPNSQEARASKKRLEDLDRLPR